MINFKTYLFGVALFLAVVATFFLVRGCDKGYNEPLPPPAETKRTGTINPHRSESLKENQHRAGIDSVAKPIQERQTKERIVYRNVRVQDEQLEQEYKQGKIKADSVIKSKNHRIALAETLQARSDSLRGLDSLKIKSLTGTIARQEEVVTELNTGWQAANAENAVLAKKLKRRNKLLTIGGGVVAVFIGGMIVSK